MPPLRHSPPLRRFEQQFVALDQGDGLLEVGENTSREQAAHACPEDNCAFTDLVHLTPPVIGRLPPLSSICPTQGAT